MEVANRKLVRNEEVKHPKLDMSFLNLYHNGRLPKILNYFNLKRSRLRVGIGINFKFKPPINKDARS